MFRALILWMLGGTFEVRLVSLRTGKDIPGRCLYKGGYWKARKVYAKRRNKLKDWEQLKLQVVLLVAMRMRMDTVGEVEMDVLPVAAGTPSREHDIGASNARQSEFMHEHQDEPNVDGPDADDEPPSPRRSNETYDEWTKRVGGILREGLEDTESKSRWSDDDSHANAFTENDDHECNEDGPLEWDSNAQDYVAICSICDAPQPSEDITDPSNLTHNP